MTNFPVSLDVFTDPAGTDTLGGSVIVHHLQHANANDAIAALEVKVGINSSAATSSLDYLVNHITNSMLVGSIASSKLVGTDIATVGTITVGTWQGSPIAAAYLVGTDIATVGTITTGTWHGSPIAAAYLVGTDITTVGVISTGVWHGSVINSAYLPSLSSISPPTSNLNMASFHINNVVDPTSAQDAATKNYVDSSLVANNFTATVSNQAGSTLTNISTFSANLTINKNYTGEILVKCRPGSGGTSDGIQFDFGGGTAAGSFSYLTLEVVAGTFTIGTNTGANLTDVLNCTSITGNVYIRIQFVLSCSGSGTLIPRFAKNTNSAPAANLSLFGGMNISQTVN